MVTQVTEGVMETRSAFSKAALSPLQEGPPGTSLTCSDHAADSMVDILQGPAVIPTG